MKLQVEGRTAYAYTGGKPFDAARPVVVFVHGAMHDHSCWNLLARWCAHHGWSVLALDLPGHGRSEGPPKADIESLAAWVWAVLDAAGVQEAAALVGHSMGSLTVLEAAACAPQRVRHLALLGTAYPMKVSESLLATAQADPLRAIDLVNSWSYSGFAAKPSFPSPGMWLHGSNRILMRRMLAGCPGTNLFHLEFSVCDRYRGGEAAAAAVRAAGVPAACVLGRHDLMTQPRGGRALAAALGAPVHTVEAGHNLMAEAPAAVLAALREAWGSAGVTAS